VVVVAQVALEEVLEKAKAREAKEAGVMELLKQGQLTLDLLGFRATLEELGVRL